MSHVFGSGLSVFSHRFSEVGPLLLAQLVSAACATLTRNSSGNLSITFYTGTQSPTFIPDFSGTFVPIAALLQLFPLCLPSRQFLSLLSEPPGFRSNG